MRKMNLFGKDDLTLAEKPLYMELDDGSDFEEEVDTDCDFKLPNIVRTNDDLKDDLFTLIDITKPSDEEIKYMEYTKDYHSDYYELVRTKFKSHDIREDYRNYIKTECDYIKNVISDKENSEPLKPLNLGSKNKIYTEEERTNLAKIEEEKTKLNIIRDFGRAHNMDSFYTLDYDKWKGSLKFEEVQYDLLLVDLEGQKGLVTKDYKVIIPLRCFSIEYLGNGMFLYKINKGFEKRNEVGISDVFGNRFIIPDLESISKYHDNGLVNVKTKDYEYTIDRLGNTINRMKLYYYKGHSTLCFEHTIYDSVDTIVRYFESLGDEIVYIGTDDYKHRINGFHDLVSSLNIEETSLKRTDLTILEKLKLIHKSNKKLFCSKCNNIAVITDGESNFCNEHIRYMFPYSKNKIIRTK